MRSRPARTRDGQTEGRCAKTFGPGNYEAVLDVYTDQVGTTTEQDIHGGLLSLLTGQPLDPTPTDINVTTGIGRIMLSVNAGSDIVGSFTVSGDTVDRETGAVTVGDTETIRVDALTIDNTGVDARGNTVHDLEGAYLTSKWFSGAVVVSTSDLTLTDVDVCHLSYEQWNDSRRYVLDVFDINVVMTNAAAKLDGYLYAVQVEGSKARVAVPTLAVDPSRDASVNIVGGTANRMYRGRRRGIGTVMNGATDGIFVDIFGPSTPNQAEQLTVKVWAGIIGGGLNVLALAVRDQGWLKNIVEDTSPQFGGAVDVNGFSLVSVANGDIVIQPDGTGVVRVNTIEFDDLGGVLPQISNVARILFTGTGLPIIDGSIANEISIGPQNNGGPGRIILNNPAGGSTQVIVGESGTLGSYLATDEIRAVQPNGDVTIVPNGTGGVIADGVDVAAHDHSSGSGQTRLAAKDRTITKIVYIENPVAGDSFPITYLADAVTMIEVHGVTDTGTVVFNIERRAKTTPDVAGTDVIDSGTADDPDLEIDATGETNSNFAASGAVAAHQWLTLAVTSVASTPTKAWIALEYTID